MIYKNWSPAVTQFLAREARGLADLNKTAFLPGLRAEGAAALAATAQAGTAMNLTDFAVGDWLLTGGALCAAFETLAIDFATAGDAGGALPAGTYKLYLRLADAGDAGNAYYNATPGVTDESGAYDVDDETEPTAVRTGTVDEAVYLVVRTGIVWSGAAITDDGDDDRAGKWGLIDAAELLRGDRLEIIINRGVQINGALDVLAMYVGALQLTALELLGYGETIIGDYHSVVVGVGVGFELGDGVEVVAPDGGVLLDLGESSTLTLGTDSTLELADYATMLLGANSEATCDGFFHLTIMGALVADGRLVVNLNEADTIVPLKNTLYHKGVLRAAALVTVAGAVPTVRDSLNVDTVTRTAAGKFRVTFLHDFDSVFYAALPAADGENCNATVGARATGHVDIYVNQTDGVQAAADQSFSLLIFGGEQV